MKGCYLIGPNRREEYGQAVLTWLEQILPLYGPGNVEYHPGHWPQAQENQPATFFWDSGDYCAAVTPPAPAWLLSRKRGSYAAARRRIYEIAFRLLEQGRPCDQRALRHRMKQEGL